jgi:hypothetical protein
MSVVISGLRESTLRNPSGKFPGSIDDKSGCNEIAEVVASSGVNFYHSKPRSAPGLDVESCTGMGNHSHSRSLPGLYLPFLYAFPDPGVSGL